MQFFPSKLQKNDFLRWKKSFTINFTRLIRFLNSTKITPEKRDDLPRMGWISSFQKWQTLLITPRKKKGGSFCAHVSSNEFRKKKEGRNILFDYFQMRGKRKKFISPFKWRKFSIETPNSIIRICLNFCTSNDILCNVFLLFTITNFAWMFVILFISYDIDF